MDLSLYCDNAAATPLDPDVLGDMMPYLTTNYANPSALYSSAQEIRQDIEIARREIADILAVKANEVVFTSGCTESNNLAIHGVMAQYPGSNCIISAIEHDAVSEPAKQYKCKVAPVDGFGRLDLSALESLIDDKTVLVSVQYANNEVGTVQPLREISALLAKERKRRGVTGLPLFFHSDAAQAPNYLSISAKSLGLDMMSLNSGKVYGPKGSGCLFIDSHCELKPLLLGGGQEYGLRSGTESTAGIIGFASALRRAHQSRQDESKRIEMLRAKLIEGLVSLGGELNGRGETLPNIINVSFEGVDNERLVMFLDTHGIAVATGSACHAAKNIASKALIAMGREALSKSSIRISLGRYSNETTVAKLLEYTRSYLA